MADPDLGSIENVNPRNVWPNEASDFTPWLANHVDLLAAALGIDIEIEQTEAAVGAFSLDLLGKESGSDRVATAATSTCEPVIAACGAGRGAVTMTGFEDGRRLDAYAPIPHQASAFTPGLAFSPGAVGEPMGAPPRTGQARAPGGCHHRPGRPDRESF